MPNSFLKNIRSRIKYWMRIAPEPVVKIYHGYGDEDMLLVYGHVFKKSPLPKNSYKKNFISNTVSLIRLFLAKPYSGIKVQLQWHHQLIEATTEQDGFFKLEWKSEVPLEKGWTEIEVMATLPNGININGKGTILVPYQTQYAFVSDIDDTFLISHSSKWRKRLYVLLTKNARTRKPFEGVVKHYQLLATSNSTPDTQNPFFFVSSSEWNLYEYLKEFCRNYELPEGVFLLSQLKQWHQFLATGQGKHSGKFMRIARLLKEFPHRKFVLLGDDTQQDPFIYHKIVETFPGRIVCVYLRHVRKSRRTQIETISESIRGMNTEVCYFTHSRDAIAHSMEVGLVNTVDT